MWSVAPSVFSNSTSCSCSSETDLVLVSVVSAPGCRSEREPARPSRSLSSILELDPDDDVFTCLNRLRQLKFRCDRRQRYPVAKPPRLTRLPRTHSTHQQRENADPESGSISTAPCAPPQRVPSSVFPSDRIVAPTARPHASRRFRCPAGTRTPACRSKPSQRAWPARTGRTVQAKGTRGKQLRSHAPRPAPSWPISATRKASAERTPNADG